MEKVCQFAVKVIINRSEHMNKKKIIGGKIMMVKII